MNNTLTFVLCFILSACSSAPKKIWYEDTNTLIEKHEYQSALTQAQQSKPQDQKHIQQIKNQSSLYLRQQLNHVHTLLKDKQWKQAEQVLFTLQTKVLADKRLDHAQTKLTALREKNRLNIESRLAITQARALTAKINHIKFEQRNTQSDLHWWQSKTPLQAEQHALAQTLLSLSDRALTHGDDKLARTTLKHAMALDSRLNRSSNPTAAQQTIKNGLHKKKTSSLSQRQSHLIRKLNDAMNDENYERIIKLSSVLGKPPFKGGAVTQILSDAQGLLRSNALELEQKGDGIYRQGNINDAIELWQQAYNLYPSLTGIKDKITRAKKVKHKLDSLRQSQRH